MFTHPQDYSHVSLQRPLLANESHLAKRGPITLRLSPSLVQQSICCLVNRAYLPFTMGLTEKVLLSPLLSHLFFRDMYFSRSLWTMLSSTPSFSAGRELGMHKWEWREILSNYIWYQASWKFVISRLDCALITYCLSTYPHKETHKHQQDSLVCKLITK